MRYAGGTMRRLSALLLFVSACAAHASGPAWPKSAGTARVGDADDDGGESLAPRAPSAVVAVEQSVADDDPVLPVAAPVAKPADPAGGGATAPTTQPTPDPDQPVMLDFEEEIIIGPDGP